MNFQQNIASYRRERAHGKSFSLSDIFSESRNHELFFSVLGNHDNAVVYFLSFFRS